jgi:hypothetical protein
MSPLAKRVHELLISRLLPVVFSDSDPPRPGRGAAHPERSGEPRRKRMMRRQDASPRARQGVGAQSSKRPANAGGSLTYVNRSSFASAWPSAARSLAVSTTDGCFAGSASRR